MSANEYAIKKVQDFLKVPVGRRELCLQEFRAWLELASVVDALASGIGATMDKHRFIWIDDDRNEATLRFSNGQETITVIHGKIRPTP